MSLRRCFRCFKNNFHNQHIYARNRFSFDDDTLKITTSLYQKKHFYQKYKVFRIYTLLTLLIDVLLFILCCMISNPAVSSWSLVTVVISQSLLIASKCWYYFFCFKQRYYRSNLWNYKILNLWGFFYVGYALQFVATFDCWTFIVYRRSILDILISIIFKGIDESIVETAIQTNSKINLFYTKIVISTQIITILLLFLHIFLQYVHKRNVFTDLKKPPYHLQQQRSAYNQANSLGWTNSLRRLLSYNSASTIPNYNDSQDKRNKRTKNEQEKTLLQSFDMSVVYVSDDASESSTE